MEHIEGERLGEILVFIGESVAGNEIGNLLPFLLSIEGFPRDGIKDVRWIGEKSFFQIEYVHYMPELMDENLESFRVVRDGGR